MCDEGKADISENCCGTGVASMGLMKWGNVLQLFHPEETIRSIWWKSHT